MKKAHHAPSGYAYVISGWSMMRERIGRRPNVTEVSQAGCRAFGAALSSVHVNLYLPDGSKRSRRSIPTDEFFCVRFPNDRQDDAQAQFLCDCLTGLLCVAGHPPGEDILVRPFKTPTKHIGKSGRISSKVFIKHLADDDIIDPYMFIWSTFSTQFSVAEHVEWVWDVLPGCKNPNVAKALFFLATSLDRIEFSPGDQHDIVSGVQDAGVPKSAIDQVEIESVAMDAYKAIEAVVGDPGSDLRKFRLTVTEAGINPDEMVGYHDKVSLAQKIITLNEHRDSRIAHGSSPRNTPLSYFELMDWQECAKHVVTSALIKSKQDVLAKKIL